MKKHELVFQNEAMLLGSIITDSTLMDEVSVEAKHFNHPENKAMFQEMIKLHNKGTEISFINLTSLPDKQVSKMGGLEHIADVTNSTPSVHGFHNYQKALKEYHTIEYARKEAKNFLESTNEINDIDILTDFLAKTTSLEISTISRKETFKEKLLERVRQHYDSPLTGLSGIDTGFNTTNNYTDGWQKGDLIIVAGRPSMGKTAFVLDSLMQGCRKDDDVFATFFSIEMPDGPIIDRLIANDSGISVSKMRNPNKTFSPTEWDRHGLSVGSLESLNFDIRNERTVSEIRAVTRKNMKDHPDKKHIIAIDYLTLMKASRTIGNRTYEIEEIITGLNDIAVQLNIPVIVLSQLSRGVESREDKRPNMGDLRDSGAIEQAADVIAMLYRDEYYNRDSDNKGITEIIFTKNRQGSTGTVKLAFNSKTNSFSDLI